MTSIDFAQLKSVISLEQVLAAKDLLGHFRSRGDNLVGPCPLHHGDNPNAFVISRHKNLWYCFTRCGRGGDLIDFVRLHDGCSFREVALWLASLVPQFPRYDQAPNGPFAPFTRRLRLDHDIPFLAEKGITPNTARRFEAGLYPGRGFLKGCVAVRLHDRQGQPLGYAGRRLEPDQARRYGKWKLPPRLPKRSMLFNFHRVRRDPVQGLVIVEDPWSVMRVDQLGIPAVALLGTSLSVIQRTLLEPVRHLGLMLDGDTAGAVATQTIQARFPPTQTRAAQLPDGLDPDQLDDTTLRTLVAAILPRDHGKASPRAQGQA